MQPLTERSGLSTAATHACLMACIQACVVQAMDLKIVCMHHTVHTTPYRTWLLHFAYRMQLLGLAQDCEHATQPTF